MEVLKQIELARAIGKSLIAQLIDPDFVKSFDHLCDIISKAENAQVDLIFLGGSLIERKQELDLAAALKQLTAIPLVLFPSSPHQINENADAILFLSLISGRNPEYLIGNQVLAAPLLKSSNLEILPTGYMLISCGTQTTAEYISNTSSIPHSKTGIAVSTALASQYLGQKLIYLDGGSGAERTVSPEMVKGVKENINIPLIVGGGIRSAENALELSRAGADVLVIGNGAEKSPRLLEELCQAMK